MLSGGTRLTSLFLVRKTFLFVPCVLLYTEIARLPSLNSHEKTDNNRPNQTTTDDSRPQHQQGTHRLKRTPTHQQPKQPRHNRKHSKHHTTTATATAQPPPHHQSTPRVQSHPFRVTHHQPRPPGGAGTYVRDQGSHSHSTSRWKESRSPL